MSEPLVSHVIISYQQERFIEEAVLSAATQDYERLEVVVADDGSTDETPRIINELAARFPGRVVPLTGGKNLGITGNSNRGLKAARGQLVSFQGGDDVLLPGKISKQVRWFDENPRGALCGHLVETFFDDSSRPSFVARPPATHGKGAAYFIEYAPPFAATSVMVKASELPSFGFDERLPVVSDWKLWIDVLAAGGEFGFIDEALARYRVHGENISTKRRDRMEHDSFYTLSLVDLAYPQYAVQASRGRATLNINRASTSMIAGDYERARELFWAAFAERHEMQSLTRFVACALPAPLRTALLSARRRFRSNS